MACQQANNPACPASLKSRNDRPVLGRTELRSTYMNADLFLAEFSPMFLGIPRLGERLFLLLGIIFSSCMLRLAIRDQKASFWPRHNQDSWSRYPHCKASQQPSRRVCYDLLLEANKAACLISICPPRPSDVPTVHVLPLMSIIKYCSRVAHTSTLSWRSCVQILNVQTCMRMHIELRVNKVRSQSTFAMGIAVLGTSVRSRIMDHAIIMRPEIVLSVESMYSKRLLPAFEAAGLRQRLNDMKNKN
jgi:hypothetical protein